MKTVRPTLRTEYATRSRILRRTVPTEADTLTAITEYLELLQTQGKLLYIRHSPSNVITSWQSIWKILQDLFYQRIGVQRAFDKIRSACFRKLPQSQIGIADLIVFRYLQHEPTAGAGQDYTEVLLIEVKSPTGRSSPAQTRWTKLALDQGCRYIIARSLDDVVEILQ